MSNYLYRLVHLAFKRKRLVLAISPAADIAATAIGLASGGKTNDSFTIPGTEAQNAASALSAKLPMLGGGPIVFATTAAVEKSPIQPPRLRSRRPSPSSSRYRRSPRSSIRFQTNLVSKSGKVAFGQMQRSAKKSDVKGGNLNAVQEAMTPVRADGMQLGYNGNAYPGPRPERL